ncbi:nucleotidyltransferase family protein [Spirosoma rigui]|uniref:nucleotidyltransferase family protein n=1 Tax=Spirosoma rigui TaxID=564064 RepID=UPI0009AF3101|nr:nucleotidyltransferase family protein [Spirosoma rigui]
MQLATLLLAAGSSSRLGGRPKQLLHQHGTTLVRQMAELALSLDSGPVVVVLGANEELIRQELAGLPLLTPFNPNWTEGLAASLRVGLNALADESINAFLVLLTDQPYVTADLLRQLINARQTTGRGIIASRYAEPAHLGVPALFDRRYIREFLTFTGDVGARKLIRQYPDDCAEVPFPQGSVDLDTPEDVARWQQAVRSKP